MSCYELLSKLRFLQGKVKGGGGGAQEGVGHMIEEDTQDIFSSAGVTISLYVLIIKIMYLMRYTELIAVSK